MKKSIPALSVLLAFGLAGCQGQHAGTNNSNTAMASTANVFSAVGETGLAVRHQVSAQDKLIAVTAQGITLRSADDELAQARLVADGDFFHLRDIAIGNNQHLIAAMDGNTQELWVWQMQQGELALLHKNEIVTRVVEDLCFYNSQENQQLSMFLLGGRGGAEQWLLKQDQQWLSEPMVIREMNVPFDSTACAVDSNAGALYVAEKDQAIWRYNAEPEVDEGRSIVSVAAPFGEIQNEIKALAITDDGALLALEEEPPRLLAYRNDEFIGATAIPDSEVLTDISIAGQDAQSIGLLLTEESIPAALQVNLAAVSSSDMKATAKPAVQQVAATLETQPSPRRGDAIDDPAFWHHPTNANQSRILATDKRTGLYVYDMTGAIVQELAMGRLNNVDVRGQLAAASLRDNNSVQLFTISTDGELTPALNIPTNLDEIYGLCMGQHDDQVSVYVNNKAGTVQQFLVTQTNGLQAEMVRELSVPSQPEGCAVDDANQRLFVGEEDVAVWLFDAKATGSTTGKQVVRVADHPQLVDDIEGIAFARTGDKELLFVSSQGNDSYIVFDASSEAQKNTVEPWALLAHFRIRTNTELGIDGASETDGIDVTTASLGDGFPQGALLVQDGRNRMPEDGQNVKLVPLEDILKLFKN